MELRPMTRAEIPGWYSRELCEAFPPNERKPLEDFFTLIGQGRYQLLGLYEKTDLWGYAGMWRSPDYPDYILLDQLGVTAARRGGGLGGQILSRLKKNFCETTIITEAESPVPGDSQSENLLRKRRIAFYERADFRRVYEIATCGMRFQTLILGKTEDLSALMEAHRAIYGPARTDVRIPLSPGETPELPYWAR